MNKRPCIHGLFQLIFFLVLCCSTGTLHAETLPEKCRLLPVNGTCKAMMDRYFFDQKTGHCKEYLYDGCGPVVPFETLDECRTLCESVNSDTNQLKSPETKPLDKKTSGLKCDPVEDDPRYAEVFKTIDTEVNEMLADHPQRGSEGFCTIYWNTKKSLLKNKYGIDWCSPGELNPQVLFD